jgi:hypothetical protein
LTEAQVLIVIYVGYWDYVAVGYSDTASRNWSEEFSYLL